MINGMYVVTHGGVVPGQERLAGPLLRRAIDIWRGKDGIASMGGWVLTPGSGPRDHMAFMSMYRGTLVALHQVILSREYEQFWALAAQVLKNLSGRLYGGGEELNTIMEGAREEWTKQGFIKS